MQGVIKWERNFTYLGLNTQSVLNHTGIKNIIFDLGGVIINLSVEKTFQAFSQLSGIQVEKIVDQVHFDTVFHDYEQGLVSDNDFRNHLRRSLSINSSDAEIDHAWNAMLLDLPVERLQLLEKLKGSYNIYLLSNTNNIHLKCFNAQIKQLTGKDCIDHYFDHAYYSHLIKMRKPSVEIYEHVLSNHHLLPHETLFLDDNKDNLVGANKAGIKTFHVETPNLIFSLF